MALRELLYQLFPPHYKKFVDVFGGAAWVTLGKDPEKGVVEIYNDFNGGLVNLFRCVKFRTLSFIKELGWLPLNSREEYQTLLDFLAQDTFEKECCEQERQLAERELPPPTAEEIVLAIGARTADNTLRWAVATLKLFRYSFRSNGKTYNSGPFNVFKLFSLVWEICRRLANVVIENLDFEKLILMHDSPRTFFYLDPPYFQSEKVYQVDFPKDDHIRLAKVLHEVKGKFMLSQVDCEFIRELYSDCYILAVTRKKGLGNGAGESNEFPEVIITNYNPFEKANGTRQLCLLESEAEYTIENVQQPITPSTVFV